MFADLLAIDVTVAFNQLFKGKYSIAVGVEMLEDLLEFLTL